MKIAVCLKEVVDTTLPLRVSPRGGEVTRQSGEEPLRLINPADRTALEVALQIRSAGAADGRVDAFSVCPPESAGALRFARARGADRAERIPPATAVSGPPATALALAHRLSGAGHDLILCGDETLDNAAAAVGPLVAELTGAPVVARVAAVETLGERAGVVVRRLERGYRERVQVELPAVWTVTQDAAQPQYVSAARLARARDEEIPVWQPEEHGGDAPVPLWPEAEKTIAPRARVKKKFIPDSSISGTDRMKMMMGEVGSQSGSSGEDTILDGDPDHLAEQLFRFLKHHDFV